MRLITFFGNSNIYLQLRKGIKWSKLSNTEKQNELVVAIKMEIEILQYDVEQAETKDEMKDRKICILQLILYAINNDVYYGKHKKYVDDNIRFAIQYKSGDVSLKKYIDRCIKKRQIREKYANDDQLRISPDTLCYL